MRKPTALLLPLLLALALAPAALGPSSGAAAADPGPQLSPPEPVDDPAEPGPPRRRPRPAPPAPQAPAARVPAGPPTPLDAPLARGRVVERIVCPGDPSRSYALYLPSGYDRARRWPVVYVLDARGVALRALARFQTGAEKYGYVLASSYDSASDEARDPNIAAVNAMWADTHARLALDDRRVYLAGFSGTVRSSCGIATSAAGKVAGVIGASAGWTSELPPTRQTPFAFFGTAGDRDFNYDELLELEQTLAQLELPHRIELFAGPHDWMPANLAAEALAWMELQAMRSGVRERDPALVASLWAADLAAARSLEAAGRPLDAWRRLDAALRDFEGLADAAQLAEARREAERLGGSRRVREERRGREVRRSRDRQTLRGAYATLAAIETADAAEARRLARTLPIAPLRRRLEREGESAEGLSAYRLLASLYGQTSFYLTRDAVARGEYAKAALYLSIASEIRPEEPSVWARLAGARARSGDRGGALAALERSLELGYPDRAALAADEDFAALRDDPAFRALFAAERQPVARKDGGSE